MQFKERGEECHGNEYSTQTPKKSTIFSGKYLCNRSTLVIGVLGYIGIVWPKEHSPEVWSVPPVTPCIFSLVFIYRECFMLPDGVLQSRWLCQSLCNNDSFYSAVSILVTKCCLYDNLPLSYSGCGYTRQLLNSDYCFQIKGNIVNYREILYVLLCRKPVFKCSLELCCFHFIYLHIPLLHFVLWNKIKWNEYFSKKVKNSDTNCMTMILYRGSYVV